MKKTLTFLVLTMFLFSLGTAFAAPEDTGPQTGIGANQNAMIPADDQNGTGAPSPAAPQEGIGMNNAPGNVNREQTENQGPGNPNLISPGPNPGPKANGNMTKGQCVAGQAGIRNMGVKEAQNKYKSCRVDSRNQTDSKTFLKNCRLTYKNESNQYKATFKLGKTECGNLIQKNSTV